MSAVSTVSGEIMKGAIVRCESVSDKTVMESVVDFFQDVVPQAYSGVAKPDDLQDKILWVSFEPCNNDNLFSDQSSYQLNDNVPPLLLILGYQCGVQLWAIMANGDAREIISLRQRDIKIFHVLSDPETDDQFFEKRPLVVMCDQFNVGQQYSTIRYKSLKSGDVIVVTFKEKITVFDACSLQDRFSINTCFPSAASIINPCALGSQWLAFSDQTSYTASVIHAAKTISKGLTMFGETVASSITGAPKSSHSTSNLPNPHVTSTKVKMSTGGPNKIQPGVVTIIDTKTTPSGELQINNDWSGEGLVAHFVAHDQQPIAKMEFDDSGVLLLTACKLGHDFHLFRILPHPGGSSLGAVHHLYTLHRGDTTSTVQDIAFSYDSRWVTVTTLRGTSHIFPITPYGGPVGVRTHTSAKVVNRLSRFYRSAGMEDVPTRSRSHESHQNWASLQGSAGQMGNPRLHPYPNPTVINPLAQLKQASARFSGMPTSSCPSSPNLSDTGRSLFGSASIDGKVTVSGTFAASRGWLVSSPTLPRDKSEPRCVDALFVIGIDGVLIEYILEPKLASGINKGNDESPIDLEVQPRVRWPLCRDPTSSEVKPPLSSISPLLSRKVCNQKTEINPTHVWESLNLSLIRFISGSSAPATEGKNKDDGWLSQIEIITYSGPHRRLWMGPQFSFVPMSSQASTTVVSSTSSALLSHSPESPSSSDITDELDLQSLNLKRPLRSSPVSMPGRSLSEHSDTSSLPVFIEAASGSFEKSHDMMNIENMPCGGNYYNLPESYPSGVRYADPIIEHQLRENLAEAMLDYSGPEMDPSGCAGASVNSSMCRGSSGDLHASSDELSTPSSHSTSVSQSFDANCLPQTMDHILVYPNNGPDSLY
ncbi:Breast carcinoma-amplified sequence 3 [Nymphon striatum]|nr:Breast carcinoma-amplified sequence 3 [Nymphon striatum]